MDGSRTDPQVYQGSAGAAEVSRARGSRRETHDPRWCVEWFADGFHFCVTVCAREQQLGRADGLEKGLEDTLTAAKKEGRLVLYGSADYEQLFGEFQKKYPEIKVSGVFGRGADVAKRILAERRAEKFLADVYVNGQGTGYNVLFKAKTVDPLAPVLMLPMSRMHRSGGRESTITPIRRTAISSCSTAPPASSSVITPSW